MSYHRGIILLPETHSSTNDEQIWKKDWDGDIRMVQLTVEG